MMELFFLSSLLSLVSLFIFIYLKRIYFEHHYPVAIGWLLLIVLNAFALSFSTRFALTTLPGVVLFILGLCLGLAFGALLVFKLRLRDQWRQPVRRLLRTPTTLDLPHEKFSVRTPDGLTIRGYHLHTLPDQQLRRSVIILAHGGLRSKDIFIKVLMATWLSETFDVIGFDFRGHGESDGVWAGNGVIVSDLKAVLDYARGKGYQKVGVYGRSMGGWAAILEAVDYPKDIDAIIVAGMPPGYLSAVPEFQKRLHLLKYFGVAFVVRVLLGVRFQYFEDDRSVIKEIHKVSPIPLLILYNETDPGAGVAGRPGHWESIPLHQRGGYRHIRAFQFTAQEVYEAAREPRELKIMPGLAHVYSLEAMRTLLTEVERWFKRYLD